MKTKAFTQNQLVAHTGNEENPDVNRNPEYPPGEFVSKEAIQIDDFIGGGLSSPFDLFENVTVGSNSIEDRNRGVTNFNLPLPDSNPES
jgi:hypothetical protein